MATNTDPGHWFLRGVQSAIFYYVSLTPCIEYKYRRKRKHEARQAEKEAQIVSNQPGVIRQPTAFQTNEQWAEELILGPGPPKPWKKDNLLERLQKKPATELKVQASGMPRAGQKVEMTPLAPQNTASPPTSASPETSPPLATVQSSGTNGDSAATRPSSGDSDASRPSSQSSEEPVRPTMGRRLSTAVEDIKDSLRHSLHPEKWNWKRYDREDEMLGGLGEKVTRIWNRATSGVQQEPPEEQGASSGRKRAATNESERHDWGRGRFPAVNDLHPSIVSQLPATREEVAWMLLPPPSAAVMAGRTRPTAETGMRHPLCIIGRRQEERVISSPVEEKEPEYDQRSEEDIPPDLEDFDEGTAGHIRHRSDPAPKMRNGVADPDGEEPKPRPGSWHFHYVLPTPSV